jgi:hypothetical protein
MPIGERAAGPVCPSGRSEWLNSRKDRSMTPPDKALGKSMAKAAAIGAVIAIPVPFVGPIIGAAAGAGYAWYKAQKRV